jgi:glycosyltransferase involved in cell wall biosynthesis
MRVLIVSGIWPPDVGGPASHAPELAAFLLGRGHQVEVCITAAAAPARQPYPVRWVSRRLPRGVRHVAVALEIARRARSADIVYATSMLGRAAAASAVARRPLVVKLVADEAYERAKRLGLYDGTLDEFQRRDGGLAVRALRALRNLALRRVDRLVCPSDYLARLAVSWGVSPDRVDVLPNPAPLIPELRPREELRRELGIEGPTLAFAGRLTRQKALELAFAAVARCDRVHLLVAGDGPDRARLEQLAGSLGVDGRIRFLGPTDRLGVLELFRAADACLLSSAWENFPHAVVEALAVGAPVIATAAGGVAEIVHDGENGLLVPPGDVAALAAAVRRFFEEPALARSLGEAAPGSVAHLEAAAIFTRLESLLMSVAR